MEYPAFKASKMSEHILTIFSSVFSESNSHSTRSSSYKAWNPLS